MGDIIIIEQEENVFNLNLKPIKKFICLTQACFLCEEPIHLLVECCNGVEKHKFCSNCFLRQAKASVDGIPLAYGGVGVKCMAICEGAILFGILYMILFSTDSVNAYNIYVLSFPSVCNIFYYFFDETWNGTLVYPNVKIFSAVWSCSETFGSYDI